jgi:hypothetical protein
VWGAASVILQRRHGGISQNLNMGVELILGLGTLVCFALLVAHIVAKASRGYFEYPDEAIEGALAGLLGLLM